MIIVWGTTHAGKVDAAPGNMFHVVTRFGHVYYFPLIPTGCFLVFEKTPDGGFRGASIPFSFKSLLTAWLRAFCILMMIGTGISTAVLLADPGNNRWGWIGPAVICLAATGMLVLTYKLAFFTRASYERAMQLARYAGMSDVGVLMLEVAYGRLTAEHAEAELARREQAQQEQARQELVQAELMPAQVS